MRSKKSLSYLLILTMFLSFNLLSCGGGGGGSAAPAANTVAMIISDDGPWGEIAIYQDGMDQVFGAGNWDQFDIATEDGSAFAADSPYRFIYLDGSDNGDDALIAYLAAHMTEIEAWVNNGGRLYINAATQGLDVAAPFSVTIDWIDNPKFSSVSAVDSSHPIFNGPFTPAGTAYIGGSFAHNRIVGSGLTNLIVDDADGSRFCLAWARQGSGFIAYGGITSDDYHGPQPNAHNLYMNILSWASGRLYGVALFINNSYVDYNVGDYGSEAYNLEQGVSGMGLPVNAFTGITADDFSNNAAGRRALLIPEQENGDLASAIDLAAREAIAAYVNDGGNLIVFNNNLYLLNTIFGWSLNYGTEAGTIILNDADANDTPFEGGPATLEPYSATSYVDDDTLPAFARAMYVDNTNDDAVVVVIPYGRGNVIIMGWDWFNAQPVGSQDGGWLEVLETAINFYML